MRITNKIIRNNSLSNINTNKTYQDKLNTQMSTQKKIDRPSDDPVIAIRALRLRSDVTEVTQYYSKNIPDAENWLSVTEGALSNLAAVVTDMQAQCTKGSSGELTSKDRNIILENLKALRDEVYATGDADYAGRYIFTGYRTDIPLSFGKDTQLKYTLTEQKTSAAIDDMQFVKTVDPSLGNVDLYDINETNYTNYKSGAGEFTEQDIETMEYHRIRLDYKDLDGDVMPKIEYNLVKDANDDIVGSASFTASLAMNSYDLDASGLSAYELINTTAFDNRVILVRDTGELLLGKNVYATLQGTKDNAGTPDVNEAEIRITYNKTNWLKSDLRPEHYYACTTNPGTADEIEYNKDYLNSITGSTQVIEYDVGYNQTIRVNSTADECFNHGIGREVEDLIGALENTIKMEEKVSKLKAMYDEKKGTAEEDDLKELYDAANKAYSLLKDSTQKLFERGITRMQGYLDDTNLAVTNNGTRSKKLALIETRMQSQKTTFETLKSENEDIDIADVTIELSSAQVVYQASLMASAKVMKSTLLDFI
ncbi:MAG: flagellar hook-associated protein FlgL [Lachnospiraceae bacterium]|nr:flagellar hook-associated protein FlgL [Lachnospiraceae bacterium]